MKVLATPSSTTASDLRGGDPASTTSPADPSPTVEPSADAAAAPWPTGELIRYVDGELDVQLDWDPYDVSRGPAA